MRTANNASVRKRNLSGLRRKKSFEYYKSYVRLISEKGEISSNDLIKVAFERGIYKPKAGIFCNKIRRGIAWYFISKLMHLGLVERTIHVVRSGSRMHYKLTACGKRWLQEVNEL